MRQLPWREVSRRVVSDSTPLSTFLRAEKEPRKTTLLKGNIEDSELTYRISLPKDDDDVMPPFESPDTFDPFSKEQQDIVNWWVKEGAKLEVTVAQAPESVRPEMLKILEKAPESKVAKKAEMKIIKLPEVPAASAEAVAAAAKTGILHLPIHKGTNAITVNALPVQKTFGDKEASALGSVAEQTLWLNLGKTQITDAKVASQLISKNFVVCTSTTPRSQTRLLPQ